MKKAGFAAASALCALAIASNAAAHSSISPPVAKIKTLQQFTLELQAEKDDAVTTRVEVTFPDGFDVETFAATPGWRRTEATQGTGEEALVRRVVWNGREASPDADPVFRFTGTLAEAKTYGAKVRQIYSDGEVEDWAGPEGSEKPAALVEGVSSIGGNSGSTLAIVALVVGGIGVLLGILGLTTKGRPLA
ncbi:MAG TPA: DUF1775 domain-containing protein [Gaiellaceae bacterium]|nr:DUF1775 domain-containing protein [Gaiellaceae bacterium]